MRNISRRSMIHATAATLAAAGLHSNAFTKFAQAKQKASRDAQKSAEEWMTELSETRGLEGRLELSRFVEPVYFLLKPIFWKPDSDNSPFKEISVPSGFVTDFASIPRIFWSLLRPDGEYAHAAIVHDYLYWAQGTSRDSADKIFKKAMEDLEVSPNKVSVLYTAVDKFGQSSWDENARLKADGERKVLVKFPDDPGTRWADWKKRKDVFGDQ